MKNIRKMAQSQVFNCLPAWLVTKVEIERKLKTIAWRLATAQQTSQAEREEIAYWNREWDEWLVYNQMVTDCLVEAISAEEVINGLLDN